LYYNLYRLYAENKTTAGVDAEREAVR